MRTKILLSVITLSLMITSVGAAETPKKAEVKPGLPIEELRAFSEIYNRIKSAYVEEVDDEVLINGAIAGMLNATDNSMLILGQTPVNMAGWALKWCPMIELFLLSVQLMILRLNVQASRLAIVLSASTTVPFHDCRPTKLLSSCAASSVKRLS